MVLCCEPLAPTLWGHLPHFKDHQRNGAEYDAQDVDAGEVLFEDYNWEA
jgi:hypothetical protein